MPIEEIKEPDYIKAEENAKKVLADNFVLQPPVDVRGIAANYGLDIKELDFGEKYKIVAGFIDPKKMKIYVNKDDAATRQAFTVAHELGHWILHREKLIAEPNKYAILYRIPLGEANADPIESEANPFAANLLVPKSIRFGFN